MKAKTLLKILAGLTALLLAVIVVALLSADWVLKSAVVATVRHNSKAADAATGISESTSTWMAG